MKLVIIWNNGDKQKIDYLFDDLKTQLNDWDKWFVFFRNENEKVYRIINLKHAREVYLEE